MLGRFVRTALVVVAVLSVLVPAVALLIAWSGRFDVAATVPHGTVATWFIHYTMRQSVRHHAARIVTPPLDDPILMLQGAAHYHTGCAPCHGSPINPRSAIEKNANPPPPATLRRVRRVGAA